MWLMWYSLRVAPASPSRPEAEWDPFDFLPHLTEVREEANG